MKKILALIIIVFAIGGCNSTPPSGDYQYDSRCGHIHRVDEPCPAEIKKLDTTELERGSMSRVTERSHYVIDNQEAWIALWNRHRGLNGDEDIHCGNDDRSLPLVDFTKEVVVAVFMGKCKTGGHKACIQEVREHGVYIAVDVSFLYPNELLYETEALTYPFCIVKFAPSDLKKYVKVYIHETWEK